MKARVVDTNVPIVANGKADHANPRCVLACIDALESLMAGLIVIDDGNRILDEYRKHLSPGGQPGPGDAFFKELWNLQADETRCERVAITALGPSGTEFAEFPNDEDLKSFDRQDRKFVAVALASANDPTILNAVDSDWWKHREALKRNRVKVEFLCSEQFGDK